MPIIQLTTEINASIEVCFDISLSVDLHKYSMKHTNEDAVAGKTSGLMGLGDVVTWQAKHFGITQYLSIKISKYNRPFSFRDEQTKGAFDSFTHDHFFEAKNDKVIMTDVFNYTSPLGILGKIADSLFLKKYMTNMLLQRNKVIKEFAESDKWKEILMH